MCSIIYKRDLVIAHFSPEITFVDQETTVENELFDFETGNTENSDFFITEEVEKPTSSLEKFKEWLSDHYHYILLYSFVKYLDITEWIEFHVKKIKKLFHSFSTVALQRMRIKRAFYGK